MKTEEKELLCINDLPDPIDRVVTIGSGFWVRSKGKWTVFRDENISPSLRDKLQRMAEARKIF